MIPPDGIADLRAVVANARPNATITLPAAWMRDLLAYLNHLEVLAYAQEHQPEETAQTQA